MKKIHIINPCAGGGIGKETLGKLEPGSECYVTRFAGDACGYVEQQCREDPDVHFIVYGGDGSLNEAVTGIMRGGGAGRSAVSVVPMGTGNDFHRWFSACGRDEVNVDVIRMNDHYSVNMINIGFDSDVVMHTDKMKHLPLISGSLAYVAGVAATLFRKLGKDFDVTVTLEDGTERTYCQHLLLTAIANAPYCGGGFKAAPLADPTDGLMDAVVIRPVSRLKFISLVSDYRAGTYIDGDFTMKPQLEGIMDYLRCRSITIRTPHTVCTDGIILTDENTIELSVIPAALRVIRPDAVPEKRDPAPSCAGE